METLGDILKHTLADFGIESSVRRYQAIDLWPEVVGSQIAAVTEPEVLSGKKLLVRVKNDVWRHELIYHLPEIIHNLNEKAGIQAVEEIILI